MWKATDYFVCEIFEFFVPAITKATALIARIQDAPVSDDIKNRYIAELRVVRALWMYDLFDLYGPVPAITDPEKILNPTQDFTVTRPSREEYITFVETELKEVINAKILPVAWTGSDYGHVSQATAMMVLLQLYMHEGGYCRNKHVGDYLDYFKKAEQVAKDIMDLQYYELQAEFKDIWSPQNQHNNEIIFALPSFPIPVMGNNFLAHVLPTDYKSQQGIPLTGWNGFRTPWEVYDSFDPADKRRQVHKTEYWNGKEMVTGRTGTLEYGALPMKYQENANTDGTNDASEYVIYRYADVIMLRAEAKNEIFGPDGGGTPTAKELLHQVCRRSFDNYDQTDHKKKIDQITDIDAFHAHLLQERAWEFIWEGKRRSDMIRHGVFISNAISRGKNLAKDYHELYPIPQQTIYELKIKQNDGY